MNLESAIAEEKNDDSVKPWKISKFFRFRKEKRLSSYQRNSMKKKYYAINGLIHGDVLKKVNPNIENLGKKSRE